MATLFISDLHLDARFPDITRQFLHFLEHDTADAKALYILGDLFEAWIGDDDPDPEKRRIVAALRALTSRGVACYLMHGNRDFLLGKRFSVETGITLLPDGTVIDLYGERVLLMHGDTLCTDDAAYQRLRRIVRNPLVRWILRRLPLNRRRKLAEKMRAGSKAHIEQTGKTAAYIMDVNAQAVAAAMRAANVRILLHGHTHRPAVHRFELDGAQATRIVLGDWYEQGSIVRWDEKSCRLQQLERH